MLGRLGEAESDLHLELTAITSDGWPLPAVCLLARARLDEKLGRAEEAAKYYALAYSVDKNTEAEEALHRLKRCALIAIAVKGTLAADLVALWRLLYPDSPVPNDNIDKRLGIDTCNRRGCRAGSETPVFPRVRGGFVVIPGLLPQSGSRCGGTNPEDTASFLQDRFAWFDPGFRCDKDASGEEHCNSFCLSPEESDVHGWRIRTVLPDPSVMDTVFVVDQNFVENGHLTDSSPSPIELYVNNGKLGAKAPFCNTVPILRLLAQAGAAPQQLTGPSVKSTISRRPRHRYLLPRVLFRRFQR